MYEKHKDQLPGKTVSRAYDELLQVKWPKEDEPLLLYYTEKINRKVQGMPQSQPQPTLHTIRKRKRTKNTRAKQTNKCTRSTKTSSLFPKRGVQNAKTNGDTRTKSTRRL